MASRKSAALLGVALMCLLPATLVPYLRDYWRASALDKEWVSASAGECVNPLLHIMQFQRSFVVGESYNIQISVVNESESTCEANIEVDAAAFDVKPDKKTITLQPGKTVDLHLNISPKSVGDQVINVTANGAESSVNFVVRDAHLLNRWQSLALSLVSSVGGPLLTVPWWIEFLRKRRTEKPVTAASQNRRRRSASR